MEGFVNRIEDLSLNKHFVGSILPLTRTETSNLQLETWDCNMGWISLGRNKHSFAQMAQRSLCLEKSAVKTGLCCSNQLLDQTHTPRLTIIVPLPRFWHAVDIEREIHQRSMTGRDESLSY
jgi:hypothetical protein